MTNWTCETVRDAYPDAVNGKLDGARMELLRAHVAACDECQSEIALLDSIHAQTPPLPPGLYERVVTSVSAPRRSGARARRVLALAATVALALIGGSVLVQSALNGARANRAVGFVSVENAMLTGKASLDDFSVEELEQLLKEIES
jgi:predicted anti-sigma-YlaC factor YlaD